MIKPFTFLCMLACVGSGLYLYSEKHSAELLDRQIAQIIRAKEAARQRTGLLRADWALLNDPSRLQTMADQYLQLKPMAPNQFVQMADLGSKLPAPIAEPAAGATDDAAQDAAAALADINPKPAPADPGFTDTPAPPAPVQTAHAAPAAPRPAPKLLAHNTQRKIPHPVAVADRGFYGHDNPLAHSAPLPLASPQPAGARIVSAMARPERHAQTVLGGWSGARPVIASAVPRTLAPAPYVGSALAGSGSLPPPVPMSP